MLKLVTTEGMNIHPIRAGQTNSLRNMNAPKQPFRILGDEEFKRLSAEEKVAYMKLAIEAVKKLNEQIAAGIHIVIDQKP